MSRTFRNVATHPSRHGGFILTLEFLLITTILGVGLLVGIVAIRDALVKRYVAQQSQEMVVVDDTGVRMGKVIGFDEHEAPLLYYIDRSQEQNYRALIGIRDDRFTSREPVYYTQLNCQGDPCMKRPSAELIDNRGVGSIPKTGAVSYLYALQRGPTYGIGRSPDGVKGFLYRSSNTRFCPVTIANAALGSRYISQQVVQGQPCETPFTLPLPVDLPSVACAGATYDGLACNKVGLTPCTPGAGEPPSCGCPVGYFDAGTVLGLDLVGRECCPDGTAAQSVGLAGVGGVLCRGSELTKAVSVPHPEDDSRNALEDFRAPFSVNLPNYEPGDWEYIPPTGESK